MRVNASVGAQPNWRHAFPGVVLRLTAQFRTCRDNTCVRCSVVPGKPVFDRCALLSMSAAVQGDKPFRDRPEKYAFNAFVQERVGREPSRKTASILRGSQSFHAWWQWESNLVWRSAFLFFCGSIFFVFSSTTGLFICIASNALRHRLLVSYPYAFGSVLYTWGAYCSVLSSSACLSSSQSRKVHTSSQISLHQQPAQSSPTRKSTTVQLPSGAGWHHERDNEGTALRVSSTAVDVEGYCCSSGRSTDPLSLSSARQQSFKVRQEGTEAHRASSSANVRLLEGRRLQMGQLSDHDWGLIAWTAMVGVWIGTMLYNVSCITPAVLCTLPAPLPPYVHALLLKWAVAIPNVVAGCLFVSGSFTCWAAAAKTCNLRLLLQGRTLSGGHWGFLLYLLGSVGFLSGSLLTQPLLVFAPSILIDEWFGMFAGYLLGSLCFLSGSFLTIAAPTL